MMMLARENGDRSTGSDNVDLFLHETTEKYSKNPQTYSEILKNNRKFSKIFRNTEKYSEILKNIQSVSWTRQWITSPQDK